MRGGPRGRGGGGHEQRRWWAADTSEEAGEGGGKEGGKHGKGGRTEEVRAGEGVAGAATGEVDLS